MSQVDTATFPIIVIWTFIIFFGSFCVFSTRLFPHFIDTTKVYSKGMLDVVQLFCIRLQTMCFVSNEAYLFARVLASIDDCSE